MLILTWSQLQLFSQEVLISVSTEQLYLVLLLQLLLYVAAAVFRASYVGGAAIDAEAALGEVLSAGAATVAFLLLLLLLDWELI